MHTYIKIAFFLSLINIISFLFLFYFIGYYAQNMPPVEYTQQNPWCRFKSIGYSCFPTSDNKDGLVSINFNKKEAELR